jgi:hypothetical protein
MPDALATAVAAPIRLDRPTRAEWQRFLIDGQMDDPPGFVWPKGRKRDLLGFCIALASFNKDGVNLLATIPRLADRAGCSESQARRNRTEAWEIGMFEKAGQAKHEGPSWLSAILRSTLLQSAPCHL